MPDTRDYYCSRQFTDLSLNLESRTGSACCAAKQQKIDFDDLETSGLLNLSFIKNDRNSMINNSRIDSCEDACWIPEDSNLPSLRLLNKHQETIYKESHIEHLPSINISLGSRCALTCVYCSKIYSRSWAEDIRKNGSYELVNTNDAYKINKNDKVIKILDQQTLYSGDKFNQLLDHLDRNKNNITTWYIVGGEPFLYEQQLLRLLEIIPQQAEIIILSGLGVPKNKFLNLLEILKSKPNFKLGISVENIGARYEFTRYGNSYSHFLEMLDCVRESKVNYQFYSTLSNITAFGYVDFVNFVGTDIPIGESVCSNPAFLKSETMDRDSKDDLLELMDKQNSPQLKSIMELLIPEYEVPPEDKTNLSIFLQEFAIRRNLKLDIFPKTFLKWLDINVV